MMLFSVEAFFCPCCTSAVLHTLAQFNPPDLSRQLLLLGKGALVTAVNKGSTAAESLSRRASSPAPGTKLLGIQTALVQSPGKPCSKVDGSTFSPQEKITPYQALKTMTINGAWILKEENTKGTLEQGKLADLVIVDKNPLKVTPTESPNVRVLETIKEGKTVYVNDGSAAVDPMPAIAENGDYLSLCPSLVGKPCSRRSLYFSI